MTKKVCFVIALFLAVAAGFAGPVITTRDGNGADAQLDHGKGNENFGKNPVMVLKRDVNSAPSLARHAIMRFDLSGLTEPVTDAEFNITLADQGKDGGKWKYEFNLYALSEPADWQENTVSYSNAPGTSKDFPLKRDAALPQGVELLGKLELPLNAKPGDIIRFEEDTLLRALNRNKGKSITLLLVRQTESTQIQALASKENTAFPPPTLKINMKQPGHAIKAEKITVRFSENGTPEEFIFGDKKLAFDSKNFWEFSVDNKKYHPGNLTLVGSEAAADSVRSTYRTPDNAYTIVMNFKVLKSEGDRLRFNYEITGPKNKEALAGLLLGRFTSLPGGTDSRIALPYRSGRLFRGDRLSRYYEHPAPGHMWMQFVGYYNDDFALLSYNEDSYGFLKFANFGPTRQKTVNIQWRERIYLNGKETYTIPFDYVLMPFAKADYHDFCRVYGQWARQQEWCSMSAAEKLEKFPGLKNAVYDGKIKIAGFEGYGSEKKHVKLAHKKETARLSVSFEQAMQILPAIEAMYGIKPAYRYDGWWGAFDVGYPDLFPVSGRNGGDAAFEKFVKFTNDTKTPVSYYTNPVNFDEESDTFRITQSIRQFDGELLRFSVWSCSRLRMVSPSFIVPGNKRTWDTFDKVGIYGGPFVDQIGGISPYLDFNDFAGYEYYGRDANFQGYKKALGALRAKNTTWMIGTEDGQEQLLNYFDFADNFPRDFNVGEAFTMDKEATYLPLAEMVYGDKYFNMLGIIGNNRLTNDSMRVVRRLYGTTQGFTIRSMWDYLPVLQQEFEANDVFAETATKCMIRYAENEAGYRYSFWPNGLVVGNTDSKEPLDIKLDSPFGTVEIKKLRFNGYAALTENGKFILWGAGELKLNGKTVVAVNNPDALIIKNRRGVTFASYGFVGIENLLEPYKFFDRGDWEVKLPGLKGGSWVELPARTPAQVKVSGDTIRFPAPGKDKSVRWVLP